VELLGVQSTVIGEHSADLEHAVEAVAVGHRSVHVSAIVHLHLGVGDLVLVQLQIQDRVVPQGVQWTATGRVGHHTVLVHVHVGVEVK